MRVMAGLVVAGALVALSARAEEPYGLPLSGEEAEAFGDPNDPDVGTGQRSDTLMVLHANGDVSRLALYPGLPFLLVSGSRHNGGGADLVTNHVAVASFPALSRRWTVRTWVPAGNGAVGV